MYDKIARGLESQTSTSTTSTTPTTTTTTQQPSFTSEWTDAMLKQSIVITFVNSTNYKFTYKYFGKWTSAPSDSGISVLNYAEGIKYLAAKAKVGDKFKVDNVEIPYQENLADKIFEALKK